MEYRRFKEYKEFGILYKEAFEKDIEITDKIMDILENMYLMSKLCNGPLKDSAWLSKMILDGIPNHSIAIDIGKIIITPFEIKFTFRVLPNLTDKMYQYYLQKLYKKKYIKEISNKQAWDQNGEIYSINFVNNIDTEKDILEEINKILIILIGGGDIVV